MAEWLNSLRALLPRGPVALVSVLAMGDSAPRGVGTKMLVTADGVEGTIGGGNLEFIAISQARAARAFARLPLSLGWFDTREELQDLPGLVCCPMEAMEEVLALAGPDGEVLMEQGNRFLPDQDMTGQAEQIRAGRASIKFGSKLLADCTFYSSAEPCAMCAGAIYWSGIGRVVYGMSEHELKSITGNHAENPTLDLPCRNVFAAGQRKVEVLGPLLVEEPGLYTKAPGDEKIPH